MSLETSPDPTFAGPASTDRVVKKRASQACHHCRTRKVKCDLVKSGIPCHNCSSDGIECVILESKRSRKYRLQKRQLTRLVSLPPISQALPKPVSDRSPSNHQPDAATEGANTQSFAAHSHPHASTIAPSHRESPSSSHQNGLPPTIFHSPPAPTPNTSVGTSSHIRAPSSVSIRGPPTYDLPTYIRPARPDIRRDDLEFLGRRGAFSLPVGELRDQLLRCFVHYVYPFMPVIDLEDLMGALDGGESSPKISLVVFQAILFSATAFVDLPLLKEAGYDNRRAARADYYHKVKVGTNFSAKSMRKSSLLTRLPAALRFRLGCRPHRSDPVLTTNQLLVRFGERPKGSLALARDLRVSGD